MKRRKQKKKETGLRRVLFEISKNEDGALEWRVCNELSAEGLLLLSGALRFIKQEVDDLIREVVHNEE